MNILKRSEITIHHFAQQDDIYCQSITSCFVQSCEVFDAIAEQTVFI